MVRAICLSQSLLCREDKALELADHVHGKRQERIAAGAAKAVGNLGIPKKRVEILTTECSETPSATLKAAIE